MGSGGHLGFMQIMRVAQSCHLGNKAEFVLGPHQITNHQKRFIGKRISRLVYWTYVSVKWTIYKHSNITWLLNVPGYSSYGIYMSMSLVYFQVDDWSMWYSYNVVQIAIIVLLEGRQVFYIVVNLSVIEIRVGLKVHSCFKFLFFYLG